MEAMERMLDDHLPTVRRRAPHHHDESGDENSGFGHGFRDHFEGGRDDRGGRRHAGHEDRRVGGGHGNGRRVCFDDEDESQGIHEEEYDDDENPFANGGRFEHRRGQHHGASNDDKHHRGCHGADPDSVARVKLSIPKFSGKEDADAYHDWEEQCDQIFRVHNLSDQRRVSLTSVEFSSYAPTW
jgi:hypothetical protein